MKQRLAFAAAMLHDPRVLVIDEPMVGLDPRSVRLVKDLLRAKAAAGQTIFMSTHLLSIAEEIADRVGIVDEGQLRFLGTIDELREQLATHERSLERLYLSFTGADKPPAQRNGHPTAGDAPSRGRTPMSELAATLPAPHRPCRIRYVGSRQRLANQPRRRSAAAVVGPRPHPGYVAAAVARDGPAARVAGHCVEPALLVRTVSPVQRRIRVSGHHDRSRGHATRRPCRPFTTSSSRR